MLKLSAKQTCGHRNQDSCRKCENAKVQKNISDKVVQLSSVEHLSVLRAILLATENAKSGIEQDDIMAQSKEGQIIGSRDRILTRSVR